MNDLYFPTSKEIETNLAHFSGTVQYYSHWTLRMTYTDGVKYLADNAGAYWLIDVVASYMPDLVSRGGDRAKQMTSWTFRKLSDNCKNAARIEARCDANEKPIVTQNIPFTDFPLDTITLWLCDGVLMLPSEY